MSQGPKLAKLGRTDWNWLKLAATDQKVLFFASNRLIAQQIQSLAAPKLIVN